MRSTKPKKRPTDIAGYIASLPARQQRVARALRQVLKKALPGATDAISYDIPLLKVNGAAVLRAREVAARARAR